MSPYQPVNIEQWSRKRTYAFYKDFDDPYFNVSVNVEVSDFMAFCKREQTSVFSNTLYAVTQAVNTVDNFRMRYLDGALVLFDQITCGSTLFYDDESFGFAYYDYQLDRKKFIESANQVIAECKASKLFNPRPDKIDLIHFSALPWMSFSSLKHAQHHTINKSIPRISTGKIFEMNAQKFMPVSVEVNHAIIDGYHVGLFYEALEKIMQQM